VKLYYNKNTLLRNKLFILLALFLISCTDYGCIEPDNFGEYQTKSFEVHSNYSEKLCFRDKSEVAKFFDYNNVSHPAGFKNCFQINCGSASTNNDKEICAKNCEELCSKDPVNYHYFMNSTPNQTPLVQPYSSWSDSPYVVAGGGGNDISIEHNSEILIHASGNIDLSGKKEGQEILINTNNKDDYGKLNVNENSTKIYKVLSNRNYIYLGKNEGYEITFSGKLKLNNSFSLLTDTTGSTSGFLASNLKDDIIKNNLNYYEGFSGNFINSQTAQNYARYANGAHRIFAYFIEFPRDYSKYLNNFPIYPDPNAWRCSYTESDTTPNKNYLGCSRDNIDENDDYFEIKKNDSSPPLVPGIKDEFNKTVQESLKIDNRYKTTAIFNNTGFIRYNNDELIGTGDFAQVTDAFKIKIDNINLSDSSRFTKINPPNPNLSYYVRIKIIQPANQVNTCFEDFSYSFDNSSTGVNASFSTTASSNISISNPIFVPQKDVKEFHIKKASPPNDCEVEILYFKIHEIEITKSGFINFGELSIVNGVSENPTGTNPQTYANCNVQFYILNKDNSYEFGDANGNPTLKNVNTVTTTSPIFVRKGQKLMFIPESWNQEWTGYIKKFPTSQNPPLASVTKKCGTQNYFQFTERPAVFCSKYHIKRKLNLNTDNDATNNCEVYTDPNTGKAIGCTGNLIKCSNLKENTSANTYFCPIECIPIESFNQNCRPILSADGKTIIPTNQQLCNSITLNSICDTTNKILTFANIQPYLGKITQEGVTDPQNYFTKTYCDNCLAYLKTEAKKDFFTIPVTGANPTPIASDLITQCYDLEEFTGSLNALNTQINSAQIDVIDPQDDTILNQFKDKNLKLLKSFDGAYGNLYPIDYTKLTDTLTSNPILKFDKKLVSPGNGFLKFIILDGYSGGSQNNFSFDGQTQLTIDTNIKIKINGDSQYSNGKRMEILLCKGSNCMPYLTDKYGDFDDTNVLKIIEYGINNDNNYNFTDEGFLYRSTPISAITNPRYRFECGSTFDRSNSNLTALEGSNFLCFNDPDNNDLNDPSNNNNYRLMFKIIDDEKFSCIKEQATNANICDNSASCRSNCCNGVEIVNLNWDSTTDGYCVRADDTNPISSPCKKKYRCKDKYDNNSGKYNVTLRIKKKSDNSISKFINSIISPVITEISGKDLNIDTGYSHTIEAQNYNNQLINLFNDSNSINNYLNETSVLSTPANTLDSLKTKDSKILNFGYVESAQINNLTIELESICGNNCIISYIVFAGYGCKPVESTNVDIDKTQKYSNQPNAIKNKIGDACILRNKCTVAFTESELGSIINQGVPCTTGNPKLMVKYAYSQASDVLFKKNQSERIYKIIIDNSQFKVILNLAIIIMFTFYGMGFLMGVSELKHTEIIDRLIKIGIIYLFTNPDLGWIWFDKFFVKFFKDGTDYLTFTMAMIFDQGNEVKNAVLNNDFSDKSPLFSSTDRIVGLFLVNDTIHKKIGALLFYKLYGIIYLMVIYYSAINYVYAVSNAVLLYLTAQFFTAVLFMIGPFFFIFILFKQTKSFFDNWLNGLIGFSLQQIFLIFTLTLFNVIIYMVVKMTLGYRVCWDKVWKIPLSIGSVSILSFWTINDAPPYVSEVYDHSTSGTSTQTTPSLPKILTLWSVVVIMKSFITSITDLVQLMTGGISATDLGSGIAQQMNKAISQVNKTANKIYEKSGAKKLVQKADNRIFESGARAKQDRKNKRAEDKSNSNLKSKMEKNANKAESKYKIENANKFANMSNEQKSFALARVREDAMRKTAKDAGKSEKQIKDLMNDKGVKYTGDNAFGAGLAVAKQALSKGGNLRTSLNDKVNNVDTTMSKKEMDSAIKNMKDPDERKKFIDNISKNDSFKVNDSGKVQKELNNRLNPSNALNSMKERKQAIKELESEGKINKQSLETGSNPAMKGVEMARYALEKRNPKEEDAIRERMASNKMKDAPNKEGRNLVSNDLNKLKSFAKKCDENDKKNK